MVIRVKGVKAFAVNMWSSKFQKTHMENSKILVPGAVRKK